MKMTERNINFKDFLAKGPLQIDPTVFALDRRFECLDSECFEDNKILDLKHSIEIVNTELNVKSIKMRLLKKN